MMKAMGAALRGGPETEPSDVPSTMPTSMPSSRTNKYPYNPQIGLGEFGYGLSGASWYPITIIGDVFQAHVTIKTPAKMEAISNGVLVRREQSSVEGTPGIFEFQTKEPIFGIYFAYGPYVMQEKKIGDIQYYTYFRPENASKSDAYLAVTNRILTFYGSKFVPFPFEKMAMVDVPLPPFLGGVGPASLMFLQQKMVSHKDVPENLLAHELAHQWLGNLVPINIADPNYSQWLSEGFATYCDAALHRRNRRPSSLRQTYRALRPIVFPIRNDGVARSGRDPHHLPRFPALSPRDLRKSALVLHMLRKVMGDEKFFALHAEVRRDLQK